ncbi:hypothetical protein V2J09_009692 [Rumex salicifolius]
MDPGKEETNDKVLTTVSPGNTKYYIPVCKDELTPYVGQMFPTLDEARGFEACLGQLLLSLAAPYPLDLA